MVHKCSTCSELLLHLSCKFGHYGKDRHWYTLHMDKMRSYNLLWDQNIIWQLLPHQPRITCYIRPLVRLHAGKIFLPEYSRPVLLKYVNTGHYIAGFYNSVYLYSKTTSSIVDHDFSQTSHETSHRAHFPDKVFLTCVILLTHLMIFPNASVRLCSVMDSWSSQKFQSNPMT